MRSDEYATVAGLDEVATAFVEMANRIVYCTLATVDRRGRPRSRIVHTLWEWDGSSLVGWVGSVVTRRSTRRSSTVMGFSNSIFTASE